MECHYVEDDVLSKLPIEDDDGQLVQNIHTRVFILKNTTNLDISNFRMLVEFDVNVRILSHNDICKDGSRKLKTRLITANEYSVRIKNFNRGDKIKFIFEIANVVDDKFNITESECTGFKIKVCDKRKNKKPTKLTHVDKDQIQTIRTQKGTR